MATSGSTDFSLDARSIINKAFLVAKVVAPGETATATEMEDAELDLNLMLKSWSAKEHLWIRTEGSQALTASTASYVISGARRIESVRRRTSSIDTPMNELSRQEYYDLPTKSGTGTPVSWYFDPQRATRTLYVWPTASTAVAANTVLHFTYMRVIEDIDALENDPDVPQEWLEALIYNLAVKIAGQYSDRSQADIMALRLEAKALLDDLTSQDQETASIYFQPGRQ